VSLADTLADQLGHIRIQREQLGILEAHLLAAIDVAHDLEQGTISSTATLPGPPPHLVTPVAVDEPPTDPVTFTVDEPEPVEVEPEPIPTFTEGGVAKKGSKYDLAQVAAIAREAIELGISPKKHVHDKLPGCPSTTMAGYLITSARNAGHDIPKARSGPARRSTSSAVGPAATPPPPRSSGEAQVPGKHFDCHSCDHTALTVRDIVRHTLAEHNRPVIAAERVPV
jgi:hypothetical protein